VTPSRASADLCVPTVQPPGLASRIPADVLVARSRWRRAEYIAGLDPQRDCEQIGFLLGCCEFAWDTTRSLELALLRTFGVAKGTPLLVQTGALIRHTQKRYDDTALLLAEIQENGLDHPRARAAFKRINWQHHQHRIPNDEYLYTLSCFVFEPIRWNARFGWRRMTENERLAVFYLWCEIGRRMGIRDIPETYAELEQLNIAFEQDQFRYADANHRLAVANRDMMLGWLLPPGLRWLGAPVIHAMLDSPMLRAVGLPEAPGWLRRLVHAGMRLRALVLRWLPARRRPRLYTRLRNRSYPNGYCISQLGADRGC